MWIDDGCFMVCSPLHVLFSFIVRSRKSWCVNGIGILSRRLACRLLWTNQSVVTLNKSLCIPDHCLSQTMSCMQRRSIDRSFFVFMRHLRTQMWLWGGIAIHELNGVWSWTLFICRSANCRWRNLHNPSRHKGGCGWMQWHVFGLSTHNNKHSSLSDVLVCQEAYGMEDSVPWRGPIHVADSWTSSKHNRKTCIFPRLPIEICPCQELWSSELALYSCGWSSRYLSYRHCK